MYKGYTRLLIVFLTHPGILMSIGTSGLLSSWGRGAGQAALVLFMHSFSEGRSSTPVMFIYWLIFAAWMYIKVRVILAK
jgi:hypothetical protein